MATSNRRMQVVVTALGRRVAVLRAERQLTQEALAEKLNSTKSVVSRIEHGATVPSLNRLVEIADALGVEVGSLFVGEELAGDPRTAALREIELALRARPVEDARLAAAIVRLIAGR